MSGGSEGKGFSGCFRCMCWCCCLLFLLIVLATGLAYYFYTTEKPKAPTYDIQSFTVKSLDLRNDSSLKTEFVVNIKTKNPNRNIGFTYGEKSNVSVLYNDVIISSGKLPAFKQHPASTTILTIELAGTESGDLVDDVKNRKDGELIPLVMTVKVPMEVYVGTVGLKEFIASITCDLVVANLESGKTTEVLQDECEAYVEF